MTRWRRHCSSISRYSQILFWHFLVPRSDSGLMFSSPMKTNVHGGGKRRRGIRGQKNHATDSQGHHPIDAALIKARARLRVRATARSLAELGKAQPVVDDSLPNAPRKSSCCRRETEAAR